MFGAIFGGGDNNSRSPSSSVTTSTSTSTSATDGRQALDGSAQGITNSPGSTINNNLAAADLTALLAVTDHLATGAVSMMQANNAAAAATTAASTAASSGSLSDLYSKNKSLFIVAGLVAVYLIVKKA